MAGMWAEYDVESAVRQSKRRRLVGEGASCESCGEDDPIALKRSKDGHVLCLRCRALRRAKPRAESEPNVGRRCLTCGFMVPRALDDAGVFELHHVAGRAHLPSRVVDLCKNCHAKASEGQRAFKSDLTPQASRRDRFWNSLSSTVALLAVAIDEVEEREPTSWWEGFKEIEPALGQGVLAMLLVAYGKPRPGES